MLSLFRSSLSWVLPLLLFLHSAAFGQSFDKRNPAALNSSTLIRSVVPPPAFARSDVRFGPLSGSPEEMARTYLRANRESLRMKNDLADIALSQVQQSPAGYHVRFYQTIAGIPVHQSELVISIDRKNYVEFFMSNYKSNLTIETTVPLLDESAAVAIARRFLGVIGDLHGEQQVNLMIKDIEGRAHLSYRVVLPAFEPRGDWEVFVDAVSGEVISVADQTCFHQDPKRIKPQTQTYPKLLPTLTVRLPIQELVSQVSAAQVTASMRRLEAFRTRYVLSAAGRDSLARSRDWIIAQLQAYGYTDIVQHSFTYSGYTLQNIVVTKSGTRAPDTMVVLGGHYDTVNGPGTDDNASGTSLLLEAARVLAKTNFEYTIKFIFFSAEEQGLVGSQAYVQSVAVPGGHKIRVMINADMIGYSNGGTIVKVEKDVSNPSGNNAASALFTDTLASLTQLYTTLTTQITNAYASDYMSFQDAGYIITGFFEGVDNPYYHTLRDSLRYVDTNYVAQITRAAVAGLAHFAKITSGSGFVFDPDPLTTALANYNDPGYGDNNDGDSPQLDAQRFLRSLPNLTFSGGQYRLTGPYVNVLDWDPPTAAPVTATHPDSFRFRRSASGFEDVMVYHHIDKSQRYMQSLGFLNIQNTSIGADPHGLNGTDNSAFYPSTNRLTFGEGGVDDAEDADVILHEYGHAIHHGTVPGWSGSSQQGALGEGFGDYWAESYSRRLNYWLPSQTPYFWVFDWDGHNPFWAGRVLNYTPLYPGGLTGAIHTDGQMWSSTLMNIWNTLGPNVLDRLVLQSHFYLASSGVTMTQNAEAVIQADRNLNGGANVQTLVYWFGQRGFINPANYVPQITHTPLSDSDNPSGPYTVLSTILPGGSPLNLSQIKTFWGRTGAFTDSIVMTSTGNPNEYRALIPGNGQSATYRYYISATDNSNATAMHPVGAPSSFHTFRVGPDTLPPTITHTSLLDQARLRWPATVLATVTDNIALDTVFVEYTRKRGNLSGSFGLAKTTGNLYQGIFPLDTSQVLVGDSIFYRIVARDRSVPPNIAYNPSSGQHKFSITAAKGVILVVDDDQATLTDVLDNDKGVDDRPFVEKGTASRLMVRALSQVGYLVDTASFGIHNTSSYSNYDIVVWTAGSKLSSIFNDAAKRTALISRVNAGGKVWVEGGEVGYLYRKQTTELDAAFRRTVLRDSFWISDVTSSSLVITRPSHPVFTTPNQIAGPIAFSGTGWGVRDAMRLMPADAFARKLAGWSAFSSQGPDTAGLIVYNPNSDSTVGTAIFQLFSVSSITDTVVAKKLIENTADFLMSRGGSPSIAVQPSTVAFGRVQLADTSVQFIRVQNVGTSTLNVTNITNASPRLTVSPRAFSLNVQDTIRMRVVFRPIVAGEIFDTLRFISNASAPPVVSLSGRGGIPAIAVQPDSFVFLIHPSVDTIRSVLTVRNSGTDTLTYTIDESFNTVSKSVVRSLEQQEAPELKKDEKEVRLGSVPIDGSGGPDAAGYRWRDSDEAGGPQFSWIDVRSAGTAVTLTDEQNAGPFPLGFNFEFYGNVYNTIRICSNGWLSFTSTSTAYTNSGIPTTSDPNNALYPFWDDLDPSSGGTVHYYADAANQRFVVQFTDVPHYGTSEPGTYTFQVILKATGEVLYQYLDMRQTLGSATIGIENSTGTIALQVVANAAYVHNNLAILFSKDVVPWLSVDRTSGTLLPGQSHGVNVSVLRNAVQSGPYAARLIISGNAPTKQVPVRIDLTNQLTVSSDILAGWNLISNPVGRAVGLDSVHQIFSTSVFPYAFAFAASAGYQSSNTMSRGRGYWGKFPAASNVQITGSPIGSDSIVAISGWNMIGSISYPVDTSTIVSVPSGIRSSLWFGYDGSYTASRQILPGRAYWVKTNAAGKFVLVGQGAVLAGSAGEEEAFESRLNRLVISDAAGYSQTLFFGSRSAIGLPIGFFEMPPIPPDGGFDARFETEQGGALVQAFDEQMNGVQQFPIKLQSASRPLTFEWKLIDQEKATFALTYLVDGNATTSVLRGEGRMTIRGESTRRLILSVSAAPSLPTEYALAQNYPNPFNPIATIKYALPVPSIVTLKVYDLLGQEVKLLVDEVQEAGYKELLWNATDNAGNQIASGVYFYRLTATSITDHNHRLVSVKKALLMK